MSSLKSRVVPYDLATAIVEDFDKSRVPLTKEQIHELYETAYNSIGMHTTGEELLREMDGWLAGTADRDDNKWVWFIAFKKTKAGRKVCYIGHDGSREAKDELTRVRLDCMAEPSDHYYCESSGAMEKLMERSGAPKVKFEDAAKVLDGKKLTQLDEYAYERDIHGTVMRKVMYGHPKIQGGQATGQAKALWTDPGE